MSKTYTFMSAIVTTAVAVNLRKLSQMLDKGECDGMFVVGLVPIGSAPGTAPTHFISTGVVPAPYLNAITDPVRLFNIGKAAWEADGLVFPFTQAQVTNALSKCSITDGTFPDAVSGLPVAESPFAMMARMGLEFVSTAI